MMNVKMLRKLGIFTNRKSQVYLDARYTSVSQIFHIEIHPDEHQQPNQFNQTFQYSNVSSTHAKVQIHFRRNISYAASPSILHLSSPTRPVHPVPFRCVHLPEFTPTASARLARSRETGEIVCQAEKAGARFETSCVCRALYLPSGEASLQFRGWWLARGCERSAEARPTPLSLSLSSPRERGFQLHRRGRDNRKPVSLHQCALCKTTRPRSDSRRMQTKQETRGTNRDPVLLLSRIINSMLNFQANITPSYSFFLSSLFLVKL